MGGCWAEPVLTALRAEELFPNYRMIVNFWSNDLLFRNFRSQYIQQYLYQLHLLIQQPREPRPA